MLDQEENFYISLVSMSILQDIIFELPVQIVKLLNFKVSRLTTYSNFQLYKSLTLVLETMLFFAKAITINNNQQLLLKQFHLRSSK